MLAKLWIAEPVFQAEAVRSEYHASTLLALPNNEYLCAWFAGTKEGNPDTAIWLSHRSCGSWYLLNKWLPKQPTGTLYFSQMQKTSTCSSKLVPLSGVLTG